MAEQLEMDNLGQDSPESKPLMSKNTTTNEGTSDSATTDSTQTNEGTSDSATTDSTQTNVESARVVDSPQGGSNLKNCCGLESKINQIKSTWLMVALIISIAFNVVLVALTAYAFTRTDSSAGKCMMENGSCLETLPYRCPKETEEEKCELKIKFLEDFGEPLEVSFHEAVKSCKNLNLDLWDARNEEEWEAVNERLLVGYEYWLNLEPEPVNVAEGQIEFKKEEAASGWGLPVRRKTDKFPILYSRLFQVKMDENDNCIHTAYFLWEIGSCNLKKYVLCLKRG